MVRQGRFPEGDNVKLVASIKTRRRVVGTSVLLGSTILPAKGQLTKTIVHHTLDEESLLLSIQGSEGLLVPLTYELIAYG